MLLSPPVRLDEQVSLSGVTVTDPRSTPPSWGGARLYEYVPAQGKHKCKLCSIYGKVKWADDAHVSSNHHMKWVSSAGHFIPEMTPQLTGIESGSRAIDVYVSTLIPAIQ